jgi:sigma-B regulation protein RsbU (phosphoserine phosphatase)
MPPSTPEEQSRQNLLAGRSMQHALDVLSSAASATTILFDPSGEVLVGPVAGSPLVAHLLQHPAGRELVLRAHRAAAITPDGGHDPKAELLGRIGLEHMAIPVRQGHHRLATLTLGDRPRTWLSLRKLREIEKALELPPGTLPDPERSVVPWTQTEASNARNMAALVGDLFVELCRQDADLTRRVEELSTVYNITGLLAGTRHLQETLDRITRMVCEVMMVKACSLRLLDEETGNLRIASVHNLSEEYLDKGPVRLEENPIDREVLEGRIIHVADAPNDPRTRYPEQARKEGIVSSLVCGLTFRGKTVGVIRLYTDRPHTFSPAEDALIRIVASQAAAAIVNARLLADAVEAERYAQQIAYAGAVQRRMIPSSPPDHPVAEIGAVYRPTYQVGGDFYDFILLPKNNLGIAIADVVGKGVPASLLMASLRSALRVNAYHTYNIDHIMSELNLHLCRDTTVGEFATLFYGVLSPEGRTFTYCNAGHDSPLLWRRGEIMHLTKGGMVLGVAPEERFEREILHLEPGDVMLLYTDGAPDALNFNDESFGRTRLVESFLRHIDLPADRLVRNILWDIRRFRGYAERNDDITLVAVRIR